MVYTVCPEGRSFCLKGTTLPEKGLRYALLVDAVDYARSHGRTRGGELRVFDPAGSLVERHVIEKNEDSGLRMFGSDG